MDPEYLRWFLDNFEPMMMSYYGGAICRICRAWVADKKWYDDPDTYKQHLEWHKKLEGKWSL